MHDIVFPRYATRLVTLPQKLVRRLSSLIFLKLLQMVVSLHLAPNFGTKYPRQCIIPRVHPEGAILWKLVTGMDVEAAVSL